MDRSHGDHSVDMSPSLIQGEGGDRPAASGNPRPRPVTQFCFLWAAAEFFDLICFPGWITEPAGIALFLATMAVLLKPSSSVRFLTMCLLDPLYLYVLSPWTPNHMLFKGFVSVTIVWVAFRYRRLPESSARAAAFDEAAALLRIETFLLYFLSFFHKLNWDFLDPATSCAGFMLDGLAQRLPIIPTGPLFDSAAIWVSLAIEGGIGLFLLFRPTRRFALLLAWGFHFLLAFHPRTGIYAFSAMLLALLSLFLPDGFYAELNSQIARRPMLQRFRAALAGEAGFWLKRMLVYGSALAVAVAVVVFVVGVDLRSMNLRVYPEMAGMVLWVLYAIACFIAFWGVKPRPIPDTELPPFRAAFRTPVVVMIALITLNGMSPYLGLKAVPTLSMFSNLRTEGGVSNHILITAGIPLTDYQTDLVEIVSSSDVVLQFYADAGELLPYVELRRRVWDGAGPLTVTFLRNGSRIFVDRSDPNADSQIPPLPFPLYKLIAFRGIDRQGPVKCRW